MALQTKSSVLAVIEESVEGQLQEPASGADFTVLREGFTVQGALETTTSDELINDIGQSKSFSTKEAPTSSIPKYFKHSGIEGQAPDYSVMIKSIMGGLTENATEYSTIAGSIAGDSSTQAYLQLNTGEAANFEVGQGVLIKHPSFAHEMRNIDSIDTGLDRLYLSYNLDNAPAAATPLGKAIFYKAQATGHPTYSMHHYQASDSSSGFKQAIAGCRTTGLSASFPATELATVDFTIEGIGYFFDHITIGATNKFIDFTDDGGAVSVSVDEKSYKHPDDLAATLAARMTGASVNTISCVYSGSKFVFGSDGTTFELEWSSGANAANSIGDTLGFDTASDDTGATTYTADNAQTWEPDYTPAFDEQSPLVVKANELFLGTFDKSFCRSGSTVDITISGEKSDVLDYCAESGVSESIINGRTVELTATLTFKKDEIDLFYAMLQNSDISAQWTHGPKTGGNWVPGQTINMYLQKATVTANTIGDSDGIVIAEVTVSGFVAADGKDIAISLM